MRTLVLQHASNGTDKKITAEHDSRMPNGLSLTATMAAPEGKKELSLNAVTLVSNITQVRGTGLSMSYEAVATVDAKPDSYTRMVTYTITESGANGPARDRGNRVF